MSNGKFKLIMSNGDIKVVEIRQVHTSNLDNQRYLLVRDPKTGYKFQVAVRLIRKLEAA